MFQPNHPACAVGALLSRAQGFQSRKHYDGSTDTLTTADELALVDPSSRYVVLKERAANILPSRVVRKSNAGCQGIEPCKVGFGGQPAAQNAP